MEGMITLTEEDLIDEILNENPHIEASRIKITERCLDRDGGLKVFYRVSDNNN